METYFHGIWRMDWGLGNPNKTAALIAILMVAVWWLACIRRWGFWAALTLFTGLGVCLIRTFSRGGLVALAVGLLPLLLKSVRPWPRSRIVAVAISIWIMIGSAVLWEAHERLGQGVTQEDKSITNRIEIWITAPRMMVDAPKGWGLGNSGKAYMQWYQPVDRGEDYRTLVNSHLTWMVELGWPFRLLYIGGWLAVFVLVWPGSSGRCLPGGRRFVVASGEREVPPTPSATPPTTAATKHPSSLPPYHLRHPPFGLISASVVPLGIWLCFGTAAWFSSVAESKWIWIVPALSGFVVLFYRIKDRAWPRARAWLAVGATAVVAVVFLFIAGSFSGDCAIRGSARRVIVGRGAPEVWIVIDGKTMGSLYGKTIRGALAANPSKTAVGVVQNFNDLPAGSGGTLVLGGAVSAADLATLKSALPNWRKLVLINPAFQPEEIGISERDSHKIEIIFGEYSQSPALSAWSPFTPRRVEGAGDYLAAWANLVLGK